MTVAVVTGGSSGIGRATVERLLEDGWTVLVWDISAIEAVEGATKLDVDVTDRSRVATATQESVALTGGIDLLVNCAGTTRRALLEDLSWEDWQYVMDLNLYGTLNCMQAVGRLMLERGRGSIVNVASIAAERGGVGRAPYCASKAGVVALTRVAGVEWVSRGVRVNAVGPGWTRTPLFDHTTADAESLQSLFSLIPARRLAEPREIAEAIIFLGSERASFVAGEVLYVDGGYLADFQRGLD